MRSDEFDIDVRATAHNLADAMSGVPIDSASKRRLREELMRRHQELSAGTGPRAAEKFRPRLSRLKRLTLVAPPALAAALAVTMISGSFGLSGHRDPQVAEAARLTLAMARVMPTLTSWDVALHREQPDDSTSVGWKARLEGKHLVVRGRQTYLSSNGRLYAITVNQAGSQGLFDWQWGFAALPSRLARGQFRLVAKRMIDGQLAEGIQYTLVPGPKKTIIAIAWVNPSTGLVVRLQRDVLQGAHLTERDWADYRYQSSP